MIDELVEAKAGIDPMILQGGEVVQVTVKQRETIRNRLLEIKIEKDGRRYWLSAKLVTEEDRIKAVVVVSRATG